MATDNASFSPIEYAQIDYYADGTPFSCHFHDVFYMREQGEAESRYVFLDGNQLFKRWQTHSLSSFVIFETGFGSGLNFFLTVQLFNQFRQQFPTATLKTLYYLSLEKFPWHKDDLKKLHKSTALWAYCEPLLNQYPPAFIQGCHRFDFQDIILDLWIGDMNTVLPEIAIQNKVDAWFLDGFAPKNNQDIWNDTLYQQMVRLSRENATFATFTAASAVRKGLQAVGFNVQKRTGFGKKRECLHGWIGKKKADLTALSTPWTAQFPATHCQNVAIIGGGIASICLAWTLWQRGVLCTIYCEDDELALNASGNKQGAFYPQLSDDDPLIVQFYLHAFLYAQRIFKQWQQAGIEFEFSPCDIVLCGYNAKVQHKLEKIAARYIPSAYFQLQNADELSDLAGVTIPCDGAVIPNGAWLNPRQTVQAVGQFLAQQGVKFCYQHEITALTQSNQQWQLHTPQAQYAHDCVILANGHKLHHFEQTKALPITPVRGQVSQIPSNEPLNALKAVLCYEGYLTPADSQGAWHCIGASHVRDSQRQFSQTEQWQNKEKLIRSLGENTWTRAVNIQQNLARIGVRAVCRERLPLMGNAPDFVAQCEQYRNLFNLRRRKQPIPLPTVYPNLFVLGGLGARGLTSAPLLAESLAALICNEPLPLDNDTLAALNPNRSWLRKLLKGTIINDV